MRSDAQAATSGKEGLDGGREQPRRLLLMEREKGASGRWLYAAAARSLYPDVCFDSGFGEALSWQRSRTGGRWSPHGRVAEG